MIATVDAAGGKLYYHANKQGSLITASNADGVRYAGPFSYDPSGNCFIFAVPCLTSDTLAASLPYKFTGRRLDPETALYYYRARFYDPDTNRFL